MGLQQCAKCTRFFDLSDPKNTCWCAPAVTCSLDTFADRATAFFVSCYKSVIQERCDVLVSYVVAYADSLDAEQRYTMVDKAARVDDAEEMRTVIRQSLSKLSTMTELPLIIEEDVARLMGHPVQPQDPAEVQQWLKDAVLDRPITIAVALESWLIDLGFPKDFCTELTLEYSIELVEWILGARRG